LYLKTPVEIPMPVIVSSPLDEPSPIMPPATPTYRYMQAMHERDWEAQRYAMENGFYRLLHEEQSKREAAEAKIKELEAVMKTEGDRVYALGFRAGQAEERIATAMKSKESA
jgi:hypothetical protein